MVESDPIVKCPECGRKVRRSTAFCKCGFPIEGDVQHYTDAEVPGATDDSQLLRQSRKRITSLRWIVGLLALLVLAFIVAFVRQSLVLVDSTR